jgi:hypothetical protein
MEFITFVLTGKTLNLSSNSQNIIKIHANDETGLLLDLSGVKINV